MARTTINVDDSLLRAAKKHAVDEGTTLGRLIERGLQLAMSGAAPTGNEAPPLVLRTVQGGEVLVDVADRDAVYDAMER